MVRTHIRYLLEIASTVREIRHTRAKRTALGSCYCYPMNIEEYVSLKSKNTLGVDVVARFFAEVTTISDLISTLQFARAHNTEIFVLGGGSNICITEPVLNKLVIHINICGIERQGKEIVVGAGVLWDDFVQKGIAYNIPYIENLSGIPGTVGASPIQNIGAYGVEVKDMISWVEVFDRDTQEIKKLSNEECQFSYRDSLFKKKEGEKYIVTRVAFIASEENNVHIKYKDLAEYFKDTIPNKREVREAVLEIRAVKFPDLKESGTAGSFFKNPIITKVLYNKLCNTYPDTPSYPVDATHVKIPLAWILDKVCSLKGHKEENVWLHETQPLVLVTNKKATAKEIENFSENIKNIVFEKTNIYIENEVVFVK